MSSDRFEELMRESNRLARGSLRVGVLEEACREADRLGDEELGYRARWDLVEAGEFSGREDRALVAFSWLLGYADRKGDEFRNTASLLWRYKWIATDLRSFPDVSKEQIHELEDDLEARLVKNGYGLKALHDIRWSNALAMGYDDRAAEHFEKWLDAPRDRMSDCVACETDSHLYYEIQIGRNEEAIARARPILDGELSCSSVPQVTLSNLLEPLVGLGRIEEAEALCKRGYRMISRDPNFIGTATDHLDLVVRLQKWDRALRMFERHLPWRLATNIPADRFFFDISACMLFERLAENGDRPRKLRLPNSFERHSEDDRYRPSELADYFLASAQGLADRFDARNGNASKSRSIENVRAFTKGEG